MRKQNNIIEAFLALVKAGLWEEIKVNGERLMVNDFSTGLFPSVDWREILRLSEKHSVIGLVAAGVEHLDVRCQKEDGRCRPSQEVKLQFIGQGLRIEQKNLAMNKFIAGLIEKLRKKDIYALLVKGQGIAQCYEIPLWRTPGDVDLLLSEENYGKVKDFLLPLCTSQKREGQYSKHLGLSFDPWYVEIHGTLRSSLSERVDREVDAAQRDVFYGGNVRSWMNGKTIVFLPSVDNDVFFVFSHFIKHFYKEEMNLRQICDWCRLLWTYRESLNHGLLESRLKKAGLMSEWKAFAALAVDYLGMPVEALPLYSTDKKWHVKGEKIKRYVLENNGTSKIGQTLAIAKIFPVNTIKFSPSIFFNLNWLKIKERVFGNGNR